MKVRKTDFARLRDLEAEGNVASMSVIVEPNRTELNDKLSLYFRNKLPSYHGGFDEEDGEVVLSNINKFLKEKNIDKKPLKFPITDDALIYLIPITPNLELKVLVIDEYYGSGEYEKSVIIDRFVITNQTTEKDVDVLRNFVREYLL